MNKRIWYALLVLALGLTLFRGTSIYLRSAEAADENDIYQNLELFTLVLERVRQDYVDGTNFTYRDLIYGALKGMVDTLDQHSEFMEPRRYDDLRDDTEGMFGGVGIVIGLRNKVLTVIEPMEESPAFRAGILPGDQIIRIGEESTKDFALEDAVERLRGRPGTSVEITVFRPVTQTEKTVELVRDEIKVHKVKDLNGRREFPLIDKEHGIAYVRLLQFDEQTAEDLDTALRKMRRMGMKSLILDLRDNPGGLLDQAVKVCELFLPAGQLIVSTESRNPADNEKYFASKRTGYHELPMVVLVNEHSASASEIVAGCLQDLERARIVGEQTFGKGSVQKILPFLDGSALRLTTSKYYTPSHKVIHKQGITPDLIIPMSDDEEQALSLRRIPGGIENIEEILATIDPAKRDQFRELVRTAEDRQLKRALEILNGGAVALIDAVPEERSESGPDDPTDADADGDVDDGRDTGSGAAPNGKTSPNRDETPGNAEPAESSEPSQPETEPEPEPEPEPAPDAEPQPQSDSETRPNGDSQSRPLPGASDGPASGLEGGAVDVPDPAIRDEAGADGPETSVPEPEPVTVP